MPSPILGGASLDEGEGNPESCESQSRTRNRNRESVMSPEEETSASPPAGLIAGGSREEGERRMSSPPSGSKFIHDQDRLDSAVAKDEDMSESGRTKEAGGDDSWATGSDVEKFDGKIVYNPDGSAYIIEDSELSEDDAELPQLIGDGCIVDGRGVSLSQFQVFPQIANAFYVSRNPALFNSLYGSSTAYSSKLLHDKKIVPEVPIMHSYRVYTVRDNKTGDRDSDEGKSASDSAESKKESSKGCSSVPVKPILMCFICKLSFGNAKSFVAHAMGDHNVVLQEDEKDILGHKNSSAIIQCVGKEKEPLVSFLEPLSPVLGLKHSSSSSSATRTSPCVQDEYSAITGSSGVSPQSNVHNQHVPETSVSLPENGSSSSNNNINNIHSNVNTNNNNIITSSASINLNSRVMSGLSNCVMDLTRKSPISGGNGGRSSVSPGASPSPGSNMSPLLTSMPYPQPPPNFLTGTTIGVCPDHMGGRPSGVECAKCELILSSSRLGGVGGPLAGMHSRNSCKTLKCPKCNWHYKYQETLEIHMKEKHPETETSCIYCIAGQPHPRLARGETYTCGYKPYRCEVCNYSTTTKGNLSIHMQSDKHLNNMQELQNGGVPNSDIGAQHQQTPPPQQHHKPTSGLPSPHHNAGAMSSAQGQKPKPTFRCDVCNYETNVARNLRIHMTSEKHTHNMMVLQQNVKHMQTLNAIQQSHHQQQLGFETLLHFHPGMTLPGEKPPPHTEAALADMAYNQALIIQMMTGGQLPPHIPPELAPHMDMGLNPETMEPPPEPADPDPEHLFQCCVCNVFSTDSLEALSHHLAADRTKIREQEILAVVAGHYVCKLCTYKTNLKANFQLHCKTDKHLQRLQHVNHVKEGGPRNEWKLKYVSSPGGVQVRCHACDYYTNSAHKLQLHAAGQRHEASYLLFRHLREQDRCSSAKIYHCALCGFSTPNKLPLLQHVRSVKHLQMEQIHQLQRRSEGKDSQTDIGEVFQVLTPPPASDSEQENSDITEIPREKEAKQEAKDLSQPSQYTSDSQQQDLDDSRQLENLHMCPYCNYTSSSEMRIQAHVLAQHSNSEPPRSSVSPVKEAANFQCPLCQDAFKDRPLLERHVMQIHSVNSEGLQRLLMLVDQSHWLNTVSRPNSQQANQMHSPVSSSQTSAKEFDQKQNQTDSVKTDEDRDDVQNLSSSEEQIEDENRCQTCSKTFRNIDELCSHQNETGHLELKQTPSGPGYLCWKKGCNQYFQSAQSLQMHFREIHARGSTHSQTMAVSEKHVYKYRCSQCSLAFKTMEKLQLHSQYHLIRDATKCVLCGRSFRSIISLNKHVEISHADMTEEEMMAYKQSLMNNPLLLAGISGQILDPSLNELLRKESMKVEADEIMDVDDSPGKDNQEDGSTQVGDGENSDDSIVYREQQFFEDYLNSQAIAEDNYNDPNRKYKCHRCKVAFTRQSYLTSHNKTLQHRKGEKLSYPMEKYLDPNRPYKCDVCKESFTQKNILLVHYNSVSHLHKLKRAMQEQQQNNNSPVCSQAAASVSAAAALAASLGVSPPANVPISTKSTSNTEEDDKKPYKCNICKVAYSQGSTLDIHMRSVLHQTRASKIPDLAITGQIDLSKPLIEQPEPQKAQDQHKKLIQDILGSSPKHQQTSMTSPSNSSSTQLSSVTQGTSPNSGSALLTSAASTPNLTSVPTSLAMTNANSNSTTSVIPSPTQHSGMLSCQRCSALFVNQEQLTTHQQLYCLFGSPMSLFPPLPTPPVSTQNAMTQSLASPQTSNNKTPSPIPLTPLTPNADDFPRITIPSKKSSQMYKHLLESFGFDLVMQFNENHQRRQRKEREENEKMISEITSTTPAAEEPPVIPEEPPEPEQIEVKIEEEQIISDLPEVSKSTCQHCNKEFSSVWVLKAHCEEVHRDLVPLDFLEKYAQQFKCEYEKKSVPSTTATTATTTSSSTSTCMASSTSSTTSSTTSFSTTSTSTSTSCMTTISTPKVSSTTNTASVGTNSDLTPEKDLEDNKELIQAKLGLQHHSQQQTQMSTPPETVTRASTPTASSTPASSTDSIPATLSSSIAAAVAGQNNSQSNLPMSLAQQMNEMQAALNVMAASQLQQQLQQFNPMMMGMAGLGMGLPLGLNMPALAAMNLQPPLVPMMMPPPPFDPIGLGQSQNSLFSQQSNTMDPATLLAKQQQHLLQQQQQVVSASQQKRARTRITDDQLKILRAHFDINNSPSEEQIHEMAGQSGLPPKVIKHWFRNTLFKERQRNKDSPYNFNNPPSTTLNLEEYEKTGEAKVMPLNSSVDEQTQSSAGTSKETTPKDSPLAPTSTKRKPTPSPSPSPQPHLPQIQSPPPSQNQHQQTHQSQQKQQQQQTPPQQQQQQQQQHQQQQHQQQQQQQQQPQQQHQQQQTNLYNQSQPLPFPHPPESIKTEPKDISNMQSPLVESQEHKFNSLILETENRLKREIMDDKSSMFHSGQLHSPPSPNMSERMNILQSRNTSPENLTLTSIISSQLGPDSLTGTPMSIASSHSNMLPPKLTPPNFATPPTQVATSSTGLPLTPTSRSISPGRSNSADCFTHAMLAGAGGNSNGSNSSGGSSGKRANRTRFTDYQIKVLQEFFENNAYPKDDDLEYLSKLLSLSPRVIVVWFQNARQKARKVYENQPPVDPAPGIDESGAGRFQRTPGLNYQCKKCLLVFQRYYELIRHQKTHCFKEEDAKRSAQAQAAAAQIAAVLSSEDSNSSTIIEQNQTSGIPSVTASSNPPTPAAPVTPTPSQSHYPPSPAPPSTPTPEAKESSFQCDNCNLVFPRFDLWREHQIVHIMNPNLFPSYPPDSPFGILQQHAQMQQQQQQQKQELQQTQQDNQQQQTQQAQHQLNTLGVADLSMTPTVAQHPLISMLTANKRKFDEFDEICDREGDQPKDKRLRTTILPEQLDYLYQKYQIESNPSRKMLENIAREVGLKKRVVQVWFQNTRARERKGQFRAHSQVINKRCPFCPALFKVKSALESHLTTKHAEHCSRGEINIDALPDEELSMESTPSFTSQMGGESGTKVSSNFGANTTAANMIPQIFSPFHTDMENSLKKYYEESMKRYISGLQAHATQNGNIGKDGLTGDLRLKEGGLVEGTGGDCPLDLSRPMKLTLDQEVRSLMADPGPLTDLSERSLCGDDDSLSLCMSESTDNMDGEESNPASPVSSPTQSGHHRQGAGKRYRTQMSSLQVKVMKSLFNDYKTPTMTECEMLGKEIGLQKRVVQVWFQNARAKEKKTKIALQKVLGGSENDPSQRLPEECKLCQFKYSHKYSVQDHIFTKSHIEVVKAYLESRLSKAELSGNNSDGDFTIPSAPSGCSTDALNHNNNNNNNNNNNTTTQQQQLAQLQMLQMAGLNLPAAQAMALAAAKLDSKEQHPSAEDVALLHHLYGLGLASFPQSFMHPGMLSTTGN